MYIRYVNVYIFISFGATEVIIPAFPPTITVIQTYKGFPLLCATAAVFNCFLVLAMLKTGRLVRTIPPALGIKRKQKIKTEAKILTHVFIKLIETYSWELLQLQTVHACVTERFYTLRSCWFYFSEVFFFFFLILTLFAVGC